MTSSPARAQEWPRIGVMGGGAIGCLYGGWLARAGAPVTIVGRPTHVDAMRARGLRVSGVDFDFHVPVNASTDLSALTRSDIVLFCTKTRDTENVATALRSFLLPTSAVLAFQNGVDGAERLAAILQNPVFSASLVVSCYIEGPGHVHHNGRGDVLLGDFLPSRGDAIERGALLDGIVAMLQRAAIKASLAADIRLTLWTKLAMNCGYNALSALCRARYERLVSTEPSRELMRTVVEELVAVGQRDGVALDFEVVLKQVMDLAAGFPRAISSTGQDIAQGRLTEIDDLNGYVVRRGRALGVPTPLNEALQLMVKVLETAPVDPAFFPKSEA
ncbi:MAG: ketopantoate reductase family protein [Vicinamibacteria bacterium]|nr:ketopantoate reductase family protein [Vicinamibacteria bacterium]